MARGRLISRSLGTASLKYHALHAAAGKLAEFCQSLYPLLVASADDFGRLQGDAFTIKHHVFSTSPRRQDEFDRALNHIATVGLIARYVIGGKLFLEIVDFEPHQPGLTRRTKSKFPPPPEVVEPDFTEPPGNSGEVPQEPEAPGISPLAHARGTGNRELRTVNREPPAAPPNFDSDFWPTYPRKEAKEAARKAWDKAPPTAAQWEKMQAALKRQCASEAWRKDGGKYIPQPATWLNGKRWEDEGTKVAAAPSNSNSASDLAWVKCPKCKMGQSHTRGEPLRCANPECRDAAMVGAVA